MAKINKNATLTDIIARVSENPLNMNMVLARELIYMELFLGREKVDAKFVQVLLNGINELGDFKPDEWIKQGGGQRLSFTEMRKITDQWLLKHHIFDRKKSRSGRQDRYNKKIEAIPKFNAFLNSIWLSLPLDINIKLSKMKKGEESELICFVFKVLKECYSVTQPKKEKRIFTINQFCILTGYIIKRFLYDFPHISINDPIKLGKKVTSAIYNTDPRLLN
jgi:hypothetical protein